jgi:hypothetical protein
MGAFLFIFVTYKFVGEGRFQTNTLTFEPSFNPTAKGTRNHRGRRRHILKVLFDARLIQVRLKRLPIPRI